MSAIVERLNRVFAEDLHIEAPAPDVDLLASGVLDSFQLVELLLHLELRFGIKLSLEELDVDDLRTPARIARLVARHREASAAG